MKTIGKFKNFTRNGFSGFLESEKGDLFFSVNQAQKVGIDKSEFTKGKTFEVEIMESDRGGYKVKYFQRKNQTYSKEQSITRNEKAVKVKYTSKFKVNNKSMMANFHLVLNKPHRDFENLFASNTLKNEQLGTRKDKLEDFQFLGIDFDNLKKRNIKNIESLFDRNCDTSIIFKPDWRLIVGLGGTSVYETGITLHHIYGIPYIPGSGIKGVVRNYIISECFDGDEKMAIQSQNFCDVFGCAKEHIIHKGKGSNKTKETVKSWYGEKQSKRANRQGIVYFFDAYPTKKPIISLDIMNVHYKKYYDAKKNKNDEYENVEPPADWSSPTIINFLTVKDTPFQFMIASKKTSLTELKIQGNSIKHWLKQALTNHGIGAKTAVGYGYMEEANPDNT